MLATGLTRALERAGIPILGVSIGDVLVRATWRCEFHAQATSAQRTQAAAVIAAYDFAADAAWTQEQADKALAHKAIVSLARVTWECLPLATRPTWAEFLARWKAIYLNGAA